MRGSVSLSLEALIFAAFAALSVFALRVTLAERTAQAGVNLESLSIVSATVALLLAYLASRLIFPRVLSFWPFATLGLLGFVPGILAHNQLDWSYFLLDSPLFLPRLSALQTVVMFLAAIGLLILQYRVLTASDRQRSLETRGAEASEFLALSRVDLFLSIGVVFGALALTMVLILASAALGSLEGVFERFPWTVLGIGLTGTAAVAALTLVWARAHQRA